MVCGSVLTSVGKDQALLLEQSAQASVAGSQSGMCLPFRSVTMAETVSVQFKTPLNGGY